MPVEYDKLIGNLSSTSTTTDPLKPFPTMGCSCRSSEHLKKRISPDQYCSYYLQRSDANETVEAFPDGLRMFTGNPYLRSDPQNLESKAISWLWSVSLPDLHDYC